MTSEVLIANRVREIRTKLGMRQEDLAAAVGVSRQTIIALERGRLTNPSIQTCLMLARALREPVDYLFYVVPVRRSDQAVSEAAGRQPAAPKPPVPDTPPERPAPMPAPPAEPEVPSPEPDTVAPEASPPTEVIEETPVASAPADAPDGGSGGEPAPTPAASDGDDDGPQQAVWDF